MIYMKAKSDTPKAKTTTKAAAAKPRRAATRRKPSVLPIIKNDPWLEPYAEAITGRHQDAINKKAELNAACTE